MHHSSGAQPSNKVANLSDVPMIKDQTCRAVLHEAHKQYAQAKRLGLGWDWPQAMRFAHHKIAGKRSSVELQMQEIRRSIEAMAFEPGPYGRRKNS